MLHASVADFAATSAAKRRIERGVMHWVRWRRLRIARDRRRREQSARRVMMRAVTRMRERRVRAAEAYVRRQQKAEERAAALLSATSLLASLKPVWHQAAALHIALDAAEAASRHKALPSEWVESSECLGRLMAARTQLQARPRLPPRHRRSGFFKN